MSLQRISGGEGDIPSLDIDWSKVQKEIQATDDKYNAAKPENIVKLEKQTSGNMYATKNQHRVDFLETEPQQPESKKAETIDPNLPSYLKSIFDPEDRLQSNSSVRSAACHSKGITDIGGPEKYIKSESSPSIWDNDKLTRLIDTQDSRDRVEQQKQHTIDSRQSMKDERLDILVEGITGSDQRKSATVLPAGDQSVSDDQSRFGKPTKNLSIFDFMGEDQSKEFSRLPDATGGEQVSQQKAEQSSQHDESWRDHQPLTSNNSIVDNLFDSLMESK